ncbi:MULTISPECIES: MFS transporter [unclassified Streptomyces]|uniref:MFS transporter n=1 Tax=unclassified Streptomyces TaxID=2593676 RepID=UPI0013705209|nr:MULTISPECIES: MFS transporter [unclassified Streptomyces]NEA04891.1 MFS transporter [Streptomyces sp. SID10116]MYY87545.1 MFS transporter [Streptomyces sp. SID335]MYZ13348.1 MFS transporter [Streptomyces sp. SID337]NDZ91464.1 MFS transporter [Streptomyces sp. SID10115]NEB49756.1 MFS transporter [Streptomyces sp. SID339]
MTDDASKTGDIPGKRSLRPLGGVLAAMAVSLTGTRISVVALPWFVLATTGSATRTGLVAFCEMAPYVVVKAFTGPLVDRIGPRAVSWTTDLASATAAAAVPLLHALDLLSFPFLLALVALIGAARGPGDLAKEVMVPEAAERSRVPLERATGLSGVIERLASTVGLALGGALVALLGPLTGLALNAGCFLLGSVIIGLALPSGMGHAAAESPALTGETEPGYWRRFGEGFTFLRGEPLLLTVIVMVGITNLLDAAFTSVLVPVWASESGNGPAAIGLMGSAMGAAAAGGSLIAAMVAHRLRRRVMVLGGFLLVGAPRFLVLASDAPLGAVLAVFAVSGFGSGFVNPVLGAVLVERVPRRMLGRVNALGDSLAWAGIPFGGLLAGAAVTAVGLMPVLLAGAAAYFLTTNLAALRPEWREMDRTRGRGALKPPSTEEGDRVPDLRGEVRQP